MCDPTFIAYAVLTTSASVYGHLQQSANADASAKYQENVYRANADLANQAALRNYSALARRQIEEREAVAKAVGDVTRQAALATGTARVGAAEGGAAGLSVDALLQDFHRQELDYQTASARNQTFRDLQFDAEREGVQSEQQGRILSALPQPVARPDFFGTALRIGGDLLAGYGDMTFYDKATGKRSWKSTGNPVFGGGSSSASPSTYTPVFFGG